MKTARRRVPGTLAFACLSFAGPSLLPAAFPCDLTGYVAAPGLEATLLEDGLRVRWEGEGGQDLQAEFPIDRSTPVIRELSVRKDRGDWRVLARMLVPEFAVTTGRRRTGHGLPEENRWDVYWDAPLQVPGAADGNPDLPRKPEEVRRSEAAYRCERCEVKTEGARLQVSFPGLSLGIFSGQLQFTVYRGSNLLRQEAI